MCRRDVKTQTQIQMHIQTCNSPSPYTRHKYRHKRTCTHAGKAQRDFLLSCLKNRRRLEAHMDAHGMHLDPDELVISKRACLMLTGDIDAIYTICTC